MRELTQGSPVEDIDTFCAGAAILSSPHLWFGDATLGSTRRTGVEGVFDEDKTDSPDSVRNLTVLVEQRGFKFRMRTVIEEYSSQGYLLASWAEDPAFVVPGSSTDQALRELVSFLIDTILDLRETPDSQLTTDAVEQKRRFKSLVA